MTTRKSKSKSKSKGKCNPHRNGRTKRGGFLANLFKNSFSWFGNNSKPNEPNEPDSSASGSGTTGTTGTTGGWLSGFWNKIKPPVTPTTTPVIPGRQPQIQQQTQMQQQPQMQQQTQMQQQPQMQQQTQMQQQPPVTAATSAAATLVTAATQVKGGRRLRVCTKKRNCK